MVRYIKFKELPNSTYFWRRGNPVRWLKAFDTRVYSFDKPVEDKTIENVEEVVLSDPMYCISCREHLLFQKGSFTHDCGQFYEKGLSKEEAKEIIVQWTRNLNPHL